VIDKTSRYAKVATWIAVDAAGESVQALELRAVPPTSGLFHHTPVDGERLDHLAFTYLRDPKKFWKICDAAGELDPSEVIVPGRPVLIPPDR
jgi:hypothetical protein